MLLARRNRALLTFCQAGMQMAWLAPFVLLLLPAAWGRPPLAVFGALLLVLLTWLLVLDGLNRRRLTAPAYQLAVVGLLLLSTLVFDRLLLYPGEAPAGLSWLGQTGRTLFGLSAGVGSLLVLIGINVFLWQRVAGFTSQTPSFFGIGMSFRLGVLLLLLGGVLLHIMTRTDATALLWVYFTFGLMAVAAARIEEKALAAQLTGAALPAGRLAQLLLMAAVTVGLAAILAHFISRPAIVALVTWLDPIWRILGLLLSLLFVALWWLLTPLFLGLEYLLRRLAASGALQALADLASALGRQRQVLETQPQPVAWHLPAWLTTGLRYGAIILGLLLLVGFVLLYLERVRVARPGRQAEDQHGEPLSLGGGILGSALARLRNLAGLAGRYGVSRQLLAAVSVQNLYANVTRLARLRGYPRLPAQAPDAYLPTLQRAFPGQDPALTRITAAYMRVHYGDQPVTLDELAALRRDYHSVRHAPRQEDQG